MPEDGTPETHPFPEKREGGGNDDKAPPRGEQFFRGPGGEKGGIRGGRGSPVTPSREGPNDL